MEFDTCCLSEQDIVSSWIDRIYDIEIDNLPVVYGTQCKKCCGDGGARMAINCEHGIFESDGIWLMATTGNKYGNLKWGGLDGITYKKLIREFHTVYCQDTQACWKDTLFTMAGVMMSGIMIDIARQLSGDYEECQKNFNITIENTRSMITDRLEGTVWYEAISEPLTRLETKWLMFNDLHNKYERIERRIEVANCQLKKQAETLFNSNHYGSHQAALSHVQRQIMPLSAVKQLYKWTKGNCWIDVLCEDTFNPIRCRQQYDGRIVYVFDEMIYHAEDIFEVQLAISMSEWITRGWIVQEIMFSKELRLLNKHGIIQLQYDKDRTNGSQLLTIYRAYSDKDLVGVISIPGLPENQPGKESLWLKHLMKCNWTYPEDIIKAYSVLTQTTCQTIGDVLENREIVKTGLLFGLGKFDDGWHWASVPQWSQKVKDHLESIFKALDYISIGRNIGNYGIELNNIQRVENPEVLQTIIKWRLDDTVRVDRLAVEAVKVSILFIVTIINNRDYVLMKELFYDEEINSCRYSNPQTKQYD